MTAIGDVEGRNIVIIDDMIDTAGTISKAADMLMEKGAVSVRALATHAVLSGPAYERIASSQLLEVIISDTIPMVVNPDVDRSKIKILSVAEIFADVIDKVYNYQSISTSFIF
jgi:ribose-phosphate pyrophosphokinase